MRVKMGKRALKRALQHKRTKATKTVLAHLTLNAVLPTIDMTTDFLTAIHLIGQGHFYWGLSSILFMFLPFAMKVGMLMSESILGKAGVRHFASVLLSIPFLNPLKQTLMAIRLAMLDPTKKKNTNNTPKTIRTLTKYSRICHLKQMLGHKKLIIIMRQDTLINEKEEEHK